MVASSRACSSRSPPRCSCSPRTRRWGGGPPPGGLPPAPPPPVLGPPGTPAGGGGAVVFGGVPAVGRRPARGPAPPVVVDGAGHRDRRCLRGVLLTGAGRRRRGHRL